MAKILKCGDVMPGCNFVMEGKDVAEVMAKGAEHAKTAHGITTIPPDVAAKVQGACYSVARIAAMMSSREGMVASSSLSL